MIFYPMPGECIGPRLIEYGIMLGSFFLFFFLFVLFVKHLPSVSMTEMKEISARGGSHGS